MLMNLCVYIDIKKSTPSTKGNIAIKDHIRRQKKNRIILKIIIRYHLTFVLTALKQNI